MKKINVLSKLIFMYILVVFASGCSSDDDYGDSVGNEIEPTGNTKAYELGSVGDGSISGTATFIEMNDNTITVELELQGTPDGGEHPAHIHFNSVAETGGIAKTLSSVDGSTGKSSTNFNSLDDASPISYEDIFDYDGHINVHLSPNNLATLVAQGDIGGNELTGTTKLYNLDEAHVTGISGTAEFAERVNGTALLTVILEGTTAGGEHPSHIHANDVATGGPSILDLTDVDGGTGIAITHISEFNDGTPLTYNDILSLDAHINVHLSGTEMSTYIAEGDIGGNELTGTTKLYNLDEAHVTGISGTAEFAERVNGTALLTVILEGTTAGGEHPSHIHANDVATGGPSILDLTDVDGGTGIAITHISEFNDGTPLTYNDILSLDAHINVHLSGTEMSTYIAEGNIGSNEGQTQTVNYDVTASGSSAYIFNGGSFTNASNPDITLERGKTYTFAVNASGHPFYINTVNGTGTSNTYDSGVTNNGQSVGTITFVVPTDAPDTLYYNCEFHSGMNGAINIID